MGPAKRKRESEEDSSSSSELDNTDSETDNVEIFLKRFVRVSENSQWFFDTEQEGWLYNVSSEVYYHTPTGYAYKDGCEEPIEDFFDESLLSELEVLGSPSAKKGATTNDEHPKEISTGSKEDCIIEAEDDRHEEISDKEKDINEGLEEFVSDDEVEFDVENSIRFAKWQIKGTSTESKTVIEDRVVERLAFPMDTLYNSSAACVASAVFDGHGGSSCSEYCESHLLNNILGSFRQLKNRKRKIPKMTFSSFVRHSHLVKLLTHAVVQGYFLTEQNFKELSRRKKVQCGSCSLLSFLFGPDEDGLMKNVVIHTGDSRAVTFKADGNTVRLTEDHKPNIEAESNRIQEMGGQVMKIQGIWRVMKKNENDTYMGLAVTRSFGDFQMKTPQELITWKPEIGLYNVDLENDLFILLASDGVWDVISDQDACAIVANYIKESGNRDQKTMEEAAKLLSEHCKSLDSEDDISVVIQLLDTPGWDIYKNSEISRVMPTEESSMNTDDIFGGDSL
eukprot:GHVP01060925.1.p1 GENE.GHVP01060925.1~~GHVP01060925.1.p1  ORF type:complete len:507 (-),score=102.40 GHVP01060925.1:51-1571(-)